MVHAVPAAQAITINTDALRRKGRMRGDMLMSSP
jgi:hypothetical protein